MNFVLLTGLVLGLLTSCLASPLTFQAKCVPGHNCKPPDCRCWDDQKSPGNLEHKEIPMMILLSFDYAFNSATVGPYEQILKSLVNPNGCPAKGTFFTQAFNSDPVTLHKLYQGGMEMALNSARGIIPTNKKEWKDNFETILKLFDNATVPRSKIAGVRSAQLFNGGDDEFDVMDDLGLQYDASCVLSRHSDPKKLLWPYTADFTSDIPDCNIGHTPRKSHPGKWELPVPTFNFKNRHCPTPADCIPEINSTNDVFKLFYDAFDGHYYNNKAPFVIDLNPYFVTKADRVDGTLQFLELVGSYTDTWYLTMSQALEWIKNPEKLSEMEAKGYDFKPWDCPEHEKRRK